MPYVVVFAMQNGQHCQANTEDGVVRWSRGEKRTPFMDRHQPYHIGTTQMSRRKAERLAASFTGGCVFVREA